MKKGTYRCYFQIKNIGIKIPRISYNQTVNTWCVFLCGIIMNILEYKRYKYYKTGLCPIYFTCGLFSIVKHLDPIYSEEQLLKKDINIHSNIFEELDLNISEKDFHYLIDDPAIGNFGYNENSEILALDYGDFNITGYNRMNVTLIDYQ